MTRCIAGHRFRIPAVSSRIPTNGRSAGLFPITVFLPRRRLENEVSRFPFRNPAQRICGRLAPSIVVFSRNSTAWGYPSRSRGIPTETVQTSLSEPTIRPEPMFFSEGKQGRAESTFWFVSPIRARVIIQQIPRSNRDGRDNLCDYSRLLSVRQIQPFRPAHVGKNGLSAENPFAGTESQTHNLQE